MIKAVRLGAALLAAMSASGCERIEQAFGLPIIECERELLRVETSPDRAWIAEQTLVGCGATTRDRIEISVRRASESSAEAHRIATVEGDAPIDIVWGEESITVGPGGFSHRRMHQGEPSRASMKIWLREAYRE